MLLQSRSRGADRKPQRSVPAAAVHCSTLRPRHLWAKSKSPLLNQQSARYWSLAQADHYLERYTWASLGLHVLLVTAVSVVGRGGCPVRLQRHVLPERAPARENMKRAGVVCRMAVACPAVCRMVRCSRKSLSFATCRSQFSKRRVATVETQAER